MKKKNQDYGPIHERVGPGELPEEASFPETSPVSGQVQAALAAKHPDAANVAWQAKGQYVVASFSLPASRTAGSGYNNLTVWFDNGGAWNMTETVKAAFSDSEYDAAPWILDDVDKLKREGVETVYVIEIKKREDGIETEIDLCYPMDGVLYRRRRVGSNPKRRILSRGTRTREQEVELRIGANGKFL